MKPRQNLPRVLEVVYRLIMPVSFSEVIKTVSQTMWTQVGCKIVKMTVLTIFRVLIQCGKLQLNPKK